MRKWSSISSNSCCLSIWLWVSNVQITKLRFRNNNSLDYKNSPEFKDGQLDPTLLNCFVNMPQLLLSSFHVLLVPLELISKHARYEFTTFARSILLLAFCFFFNVACWVVSGILFGRQKSTRDILSLCLLAWVRVQALHSHSCSNE